MEPIRGPLDYHRYPSKTKRSEPKPSAVMSSSESTPNQPRRRSAPSASTGRHHAGGEGRVLRRPHERRTEQEQRASLDTSTVLPEHAALDSEAYNDWLEGRHRGPQARRAAHRQARKVARSGDAMRSGDTPRSGGTRKNSVAIDAPVDGHDLPVEEAPPAQSGKKKRHKRGLWERRRKTEKPALKRFRTPFWKIARRITICLLLIGVGELVLAALTTPRLAVQKVEVIGAQVTPDEALQPITQQLTGQNWIRVRTQNAALAARHLPSVKEARIERVLSLPPMKLALRITERQPFARVGAGTDWWVVDRDGVPFRRADKKDENLHAVSSPALRPEEIQLGKALPEKSWKPFVVLAEALENDMKSGGQWQLRRTYLDKFGFAPLRLTGGSNDELLVRLGGGQWPQKLQRARQALDYFAATGRRAAALNLVSYNMPTWTPRRAVNDTNSDAPSPSETGGAGRDSSASHKVTTDDEDGASADNADATSNSAVSAPGGTGT